MKNLGLSLIIALSLNTFSGCAQKDQKDQKPPSAEKIIAELDKDEDGKLSKKEVKGPLKDDFTIIDINKDGYITKEEIEKGPKPDRNGPPPNQGKK